MHGAPTPRIETTRILVSKMLCVNWEQILDLTMISMRPPIADANSTLTFASERTPKIIITELSLRHVAMRETLLGLHLNAIAILQVASTWILSVVGMEGVMNTCWHSATRITAVFQ